MYFDGLSQSKISDRLRLLLGTVKSRTLLGMRRLRGLIGGGRDDAQPREDRGAHRVPFDLRARSAGAGRARARDGLAPPDCEECRRLETEYGEVGGRLAFALEPVALAGFADETIELAIGELQGRIEGREPAAGARRRGGGAGAVRRWRHRGSIGVRRRRGVLGGDGAELRTAGSGTLPERSPPFTPAERIYLQGSGSTRSRRTRSRALADRRRDPAAAVCVRPSGRTPGVRVRRHRGGDGRAPSRDG